MLQVSAALSYYFVLSVFPALIFLSAIVGFISLPELFNHVLLLMDRLLPQDTMKMVYSVLGDVLASHRGTWLSFGMLGLAAEKKKNDLARRHSPTQMK